MTAFFILSGYVIKYNYPHDTFPLIQFYKKRFISIIPAYWCIAILFTIFTIIVLLFHKSEELPDFLKTTGILMPIHVLALQSAFSSVFQYSHNGGTWFVSCLLICYFIFPLLCRISNELSNRSKIVLISLLVFILLYSSLIPHLLENVHSIYSSIFFRLCEFFIGVLLVGVKIPIWASKMLWNWKAFVIEMLILLFGITLAINLGIPASAWMVLSFCSLPCFIVMIETLSHIKSTKWLQTRTIDYVCKISYMFFFAQFFTWIPMRFLRNYYGLESNFFKIAFSFALCLLISILLYEFCEKPIKSFFSKRFLTN